MLADVPTILLLSGGALLAGLIMGLAGFGTGLVALGIWLHVTPPETAVALVLTCSLVSTLVSLRMVWHEVDFSTLFPMLAGGAVGLPLGIVFLAEVNPDIFKVFIGITLISYALFRLWIMPNLALKHSHKSADFSVGIGGGLLCGFAGVPGPLSTVWVGLKGWKKDKQRALYQSYNFSLVCMALVLFFFRGWLQQPVWTYTVICLPALGVGLVAGMAGYNYLNDKQFHSLILWLLAAVGVALLVMS